MQLVGGLRVVRSGLVWSCLGMRSPKWQYPSKCHAMPCHALQVPMACASVPAGARSGHQGSEGPAPCGDDAVGPRGRAGEWVVGRVVPVGRSELTHEPRRECPSESEHATSALQSAPEQSLGQVPASQAQTGEAVPAARRAQRRSGASSPAPSTPLVLLKHHGPSPPPPAVVINP